MLCGNSAIVDFRQPEMQNFKKVYTIPIRCNLMKCSRERQDQWASGVEKYVINEEWNTSRNSTEDEAQWIVTTAAKI